MGLADPVTDADESTGFVREAHGLVRDLLEPRPGRYWTDFLLTIVAVYTAFAVYVRAPNFSVLQAAALVVRALGMYRAVVFTHEITHRPAGSFTAFTVAWNASCGIPFWMPSFLYGDHKGHHVKPTYGTRADPEYILLASRPRARFFLLLSLALGSARDPLSPSRCQSDRAPWIRPIQGKDTPWLTDSAGCGWRSDCPAYVARGPS